MTIDAHQHFWHYHREKHAWIDDAMAAIRKDFLPSDLQPILQTNSVDACVAVQADETEAENDFLIGLAQQNPFIKGVVGWVDFCDARISERLSYYQAYNIVKGFRVVLQGRDPEYMLQRAFLDGIGALQPFNFTYDILIFPRHLEAALALVKRFPQQPFVIDHIAKPYIKAGLIDEWKNGMQQLAAQSNAYCKISGMVTEADYQKWKPADFTPYLDAVVESFGTKRLMYGSDWPVCEVAATYAQMKKIVDDYFSSFSAEEKADVFGNNTYRFYNIEM